MSERRTVALLIVLVVVQLALLTSQVPDPRDRRQSRLEAFALGALAPVARTTSATLGVLRGGVDRLSTVSSLRRENEELRGRVLELERELTARRDQELELELLEEALDYTPPDGARLRVCDVVLVDHVSWFRTLVIRTTGLDLAPGTPVVASGGLVGRIVSSASGFSRVQLVTDRASSVGAMIRRTRRQGVLRGSAGGGQRLDYVPLQADVRQGDRVVTAGIDGVFPRGIPVGVVTAVNPGPQLFHDVSVAPNVDFGSLTQVFVLEVAPIPAELLDEGAVP